jgi:hypothetical protein
MRMPPSGALLALVLMALSALAMACGSEDSQLLTERRAARLTADLDRVATAVREGDCSATAVRLEELRAEIADVPATVASSLRQRLSSGAARLAERAQDECQGERTQTLETTEEPTDTTPVEPLETTTTETTTTETEPPAETQTTPTETEPPAETQPPAETGTVPAPVPPAEDPAGTPQGDTGSGGVGDGAGTG